VKKNRISLAGRFIHSRSDGVKTAEIYYAHVKFNRRIGTRAYLLGYTSYDQNKLAGYNFRVALSFGGGLTWIKRERTTFLTELAFGLNNEENTKQVALKTSLELIYDNDPVPGFKHTDTYLLSSLVIKI